MNEVLESCNIKLALFGRFVPVNQSHNPLCSFTTGPNRLKNSCVLYVHLFSVATYQFDGYIEVMNAGGLYGEARPENFLSVNDYRNPLVAEAMRVMKYVNKFNRSVTRVQEMLKDNGNSPAEFNVNTITVFRIKSTPQASPTWGQP